MVSPGKTAACLLFALLVAGAPALADPSMPPSTSPSAAPTMGLGVPLARMDPNAPLPPISIQSDRQEAAPKARSFSADGHVVVVGGREFLLLADHVAGDLSTGVTQASGHVFLRELDTTAAASSAHFNLKNHTGLFTDVTLTQESFDITASRITVSANRIQATDARFSTCPPGMKQDYHVQSGTLTYSAQTGRLVATDASVYLGGTRIAHLSRLVLSLGKPGQPRPNSQLIHQQLGYNKYDGVYVGLGAQPHVLGQPLVTSLILPGRSTPEVTTTISLPILAPRPTAAAGNSTIAAMRQIAQSRAPLLPPGDPLLYHNFGPSTPFDNLLTQFQNQPTVSATFTGAYRQRIYGKRISDLTVSRLPEVGLVTYVPLFGHQALPTDQNPEHVRQSLRQFALRLVINPQYGYYHEFPSGVHHPRQATEVGLAPRPLLIGKNTLFAPRLLLQHNIYSTSGTYRYLQYALGVQHYVTDRTAFGVDYIKSQVEGQTPFVFDRLDTTQELDVRGQTMAGPHILNVLLRYDLNRGSLFEWQLTYGRMLHCLVPTLSYDARSHNFSVGLNIQGFNF